MKRIFTLVIISLIGTVSVFADTVCSKDGSRVRFTSDDGAVLELKMCSQGPVCSGWCHGAGQEILCCRK